MATAQQRQRQASKGAYLGSARLKAAMVKEMAAHEAADQIIKGTYGRGEGTAFRGCAIGCALDSLNHVRRLSAPTNQHQRLVEELHIPIELVYVIDHFFESLPDVEAKTWPGRVLRAIPVGADLEGVVPTLMQWTILDPTYG